MCFLWRYNTRLFLSSINLGLLPFSYLHHSIRSNFALWLFAGLYSPFAFLLSVLISTSKLPVPFSSSSSVIIYIMITVPMNLFTAQSVAGLRFPHGHGPRLNHCPLYT